MPLSSIENPISRSMVNSRYTLISSKHDTEKVKALIALGYPANEYALPEFIEWLQDINWPVAQVLAPFLASIGAPLAPYIETALLEAEQTRDGIWKYWLLMCVVKKSRPLAEALRPEIETLALSTGAHDIDDEVDLAAREILSMLAHAA
jgi:hypothetical protein